MTLNESDIMYNELPLTSRSMLLTVYMKFACTIECDACTHLIVCSVGETAEKINR